LRLRFDETIKDKVYTANESKIFSTNNLFCSEAIWIDLGLEDI
jgi:hypothetical protein